MSRPAAATLGFVAGLLLMSADQVPLPTLALIAAAVVIAVTTIELEDNTA